jgi:hypothetical protein
MDDLSIEELASNLSTYKEQLGEVPLSLSLAPLSFPFAFRFLSLTFGIHLV